MVSLPLVRPYLKNNVMNLAVHFVACRCSWNVLFCIGSFIKAACSSNRHILALKADSKLFEEVLEPLKKATALSKSRDTDMFGNSSKDDEDTPALDQPFINPYEQVFLLNVLYVDFIYLFTFNNNFPCLNYRII